MTDFAKTREFFHLPEGMTYLDGNSLGPLPKTAMDRLRHVAEEEWGTMVIGGWNRAGWMAAPSVLGDRVGGLIGAATGTTVLGDTLSIKVFQAVSAACQLRPDRKVVLSDTGNFPSDLYMADGLMSLLGEGFELRLVNPEDVADAIGPDIACTLLTEVDYRTGRRHDMAALTKRAHDAGALAVWDLAHSAGALPVDVQATRVDFAVGCTYKYLNGGPGAPAFIYVAPAHIDQIRPTLAGWLGHAAPFDFELDYRAGGGIERMRVGTPPIVQMAALEAALAIWDDVNIEDVRRKSLELGDLFIEEVTKRCPEVTLVTPRSHAERGSHVCFSHPAGYAVMQALIARQVIGDFRAPNILRFGITPLFVGEAEIITAAQTLEDILDTKAWDRPDFHQRARVT